MRFGHFIFTIGLIGAGLSACTPSTATRGNYLEAEDIQSIQPMASTDYDVLNLLGTPTAKAVFDDKTWYYVGLKTEQTSFLDPKVIDRQIYRITFDESGFVKTVEQVTEDPVKVPLSDRITPTSGHDLTVLQQILGNVGRFNTEQK